ncbi:hypothetical protein BO443_30050 [Burkholderia orbicola]
MRQYVSPLQLEIRTNHGRLTPFYPRHLKIS